MDKNTRYAVKENNDGKAVWFTYGSRYQAKKALSNGVYFPGEQYPTFEGEVEILTYRQMQKRGLIN